MLLLHSTEQMAPRLEMKYVQGSKNTANHKPVQTLVTFATRPQWYSHPLGIFPKVQLLYILSCCQYHCPHKGEQECWPTVLPVSAVLAIRSNQCYRLPFLSWESGCRLWNNPQSPPPFSQHTHTHTWPLAKGRGRLLEQPINAFSFSMYIQLPVHVQWEMFDLPKRKRRYISSLNSLLDSLNTSKKSSHSSRSPCQHTSYITRMPDCLLPDL